MASLPIVTLHRDLEYLTEEQVNTEVEKSFDEIVATLTGPAKPAAGR